MIPVAIALLQSQTVPLIPFVDDGATKTHAIDPLVIRLSPSGSARTGTIRLGTKGYRVWQRPGPSLFVDRNGNGQPEATERVRLTSRTISPDGSLQITLYQGVVNLGAYARFDVRFIDPNVRHPQLQTLRQSLMVMPNFGYVGHAKFSGKTLRFAIRGGDPKNATLFVDRDGDGVLGTVPAELFELSRPFNIGGTTYQAASFQPGERPSVRFAPSSQRVAEVFMPANLKVGEIAPTLVSQTLSGRKVTFPNDFRGKLVLLDVWATWCILCRPEIPYIKSAYANYRKRGFEVVGFSIDKPGTQKQVAAFLKAYKIGWPQAFEGKEWESPVCRRYGITDLPFLLLIDGSTGKILATTKALQGRRLAATLEGVLAQRGR